MTIVEQPAREQRDGPIARDCYMQRDFYFDVRAVNEDSRTVELSFSSELAYERYWGTEILDHGPDSMELARLNGGAALLVNHDACDQVGVVERAWIEARKGKATVRFGKSQRAEEIYQDVRDGIRKLVSVGYQIKDFVSEGRTSSGETYRVTRWEPYEISLVAVPADASVGVGREAARPPLHVETLQIKEKMMTEVVTPVAVAAVAAAPIDLSAERNAAAAAERERAANIAVLGQRMNCAALANNAIANGTTLDAFIREMNDKLPASQALRVAEDPAIGLSENEVRRFSFVRLICALANPTERAAQEAAAFEIECSRAAQVNAETEVRGHRIPVDVLRAALTPRVGQRDLVVGTATAGGNLVATDLDSASFIDLLRNRLEIQGLGARMLTDLSGNLAIPRQTGGATAYWVGEGTAPTESQQAFDQVSLTPKTLGAFTDFSRQLIKQSSIDVETMVRDDLAKVIALAIDLAAISGTGSSNQPRGVLNVSGIGSEAGGTNGAAPTWANIVNLEGKVAAANADFGSLGYLTNSKVRNALKLTQKFASTNGDPVWEKGNEMNGYKAAVSNQVPSNGTKGSGTNLSSIIFGNWADLIIGMWGGLDLMTNPYVLSATGTVRVEAFQSVDVAVRQPASFAAMIDAIAA